MIQSTPAPTAGQSWTNFWGEDCISYRLSHLHGCRIGEASHPGPPADSINFCIVNPTNLVTKHQQFSQLVETHDVHVLGLAETTATSHIQLQFATQMKRHGFQTVWSAPVQPQRIRLDGHFSNKGRSGGTAICAKLPLRPCRMVMDPRWNVTTRLVHGIVQLGPLHIQVFVIYGATSSIPDSQAFTESLVQYAIERSKCIDVPAIFLGDFNMNIHQCQAFGALFDRGYQSLQTIYASKYGVPFPTTCAEATSPDTAVLHPTLLPLVTAVTVDKAKLFATHDPVIFSLQIPDQAISRTRLISPATWTKLPLNPEEVKQHFLDTWTSPSDNTLIAWRQQVEQGISELLTTQHVTCPILHPTTRLPKKYRGRGVAPKPKCQPMQAQVKRARAGVYEPPGEVTTIQTKRVVTQLRRIQSLRARVRKADRYADSRLSDQLQSEWTCILTSQCLGYPFGFWIQDLPELGPPPVAVPTFEYLDTLAQLFQYVVDDMVYHDVQMRKRLMAWGKYHDKKDGHSKRAFAQTRGVGLPPLTKVATRLDETGGLVEQCHHTPPHPTTLTVAVHRPDRFSSEHQVWIDGFPFTIQQVAAHTLVMQGTLQHPLSGEECQVQQTIDHYHRATSQRVLEPVLAARCH